MLPVSLPGLPSACSQSWLHPGSNPGNQLAVGLTPKGQTALGGRWALGAGRWAAYRAVLTDPPGRDLCAADSDPRRHQRHSCLSVPIHVSGPHAIEVYVHSSPFRRLLVMRGRGQVAVDHLCSTSLPSRRRHRAPNHPVLFAEAGGRLLKDPGGSFFFFLQTTVSPARPTLGNSAISLRRPNTAPVGCP